MDTYANDQPKCSRCQASLPAGTVFCPKCGAAADGGETQASDQPQPRAASGSLRKAVDNRWLVLGLLFFVTAALGLPVLWASRSFSRPMKTLLSIVVTIYTALILWLFCLLMVWCYTRITDALR